MLAMRISFALILPMLLLSACVGPPKGHRPTGQGQSQSLASDKETRQCVADLGRMKARYSLLPERDFGGGCSIKGSVQLFAADVPVTAVKAIRCPVARNLTLWMREDVQAAARDHLGARVTRMDSMGAYSCRRVNGAATGRLSEHATGNAIDIGGFLLSDGRRVSVKAGWSGADTGERKFLRDIRASACKRFQTVLSPDYNAAHHDHLHFDMGGKPFCR